MTHNPVMLTPLATVNLAILVYVFLLQIRAFEQQFNVSYLFNVAFAMNTGCVLTDIKGALDVSFLIN
jgi:hypothetical protein